MLIMWWFVGESALYAIVDAIEKVYFLSAIKDKKYIYYVLQTYTSNFIVILGAFFCLLHQSYTIYGW